MAKTSKSAWTGRERQAAALFGSRRQRCSGSSGRDDYSRSDSTHPRLFVETKLRASHAAVALFDETRALAKDEGKVPVVVLAQKGRPGLLLVIDPADLPEVAREYQAARPEESPAPEPTTRPKAKPKPIQAPTLFDDLD